MAGRARKLALRLSILATLVSAGAVAVRAGWVDSFVFARWSGCPVDGAATAQAYYQRGAELKERGWAEGARVCMDRAMAAAGEGELAARARHFARTRLPRQPVSLWAEWRNIRAVNAWQAGELAEAIGDFRALLDDYPAFEWPYSNLAALYLDRGEPEGAVALLERALAINPQYVSALVNMGRAKLILKRPQEAKIFAIRALELAPQDPAARELGRALQAGAP